MILGKLLVSATYAARMPPELYNEESDLTFFELILFVLSVCFVIFLFVLVRNLIRDACRLITDTWRLKTRIPRVQVYHGIAFPKNMVVYISDFNIPLPKPLNTSLHASLNIWIFPYALRESSGYPSFAQAINYQPILLLEDNEQNNVVMLVNDREIYRVPLHFRWRGLHGHSQLMIYSDQVTLDGTRLKPLMYQFTS